MYVTRHFPKHCGTPPSCVEEKGPRNDLVRAVNSPKMYATRDFPEHSGNLPGHDEEKGSRASREHNVRVGEPGNVMGIVNGMADVDRIKVKEALRLFRDVYKEVLDKYKAEWEDKELVQEDLTWEKRLD